MIILYYDIDKLWIINVKIMNVKKGVFNFRF